MCYERNSAGRVAGMKVAQIGVELSPRGGGTYRTAVAFRSALTSFGAEVESFSCSLRDELDSASVFYPIRASHIWPLRKYWWSPALYRDLERTIKRSDAVIIHGLYYHGCVAAAQLSSKHGVPYLLVVHGGLDPYVFTYRKWRKRAWLAAYRHELFEKVAGLIFSSEREKEKAANFGSSLFKVVLHWPVPEVAAFDKGAAKATLCEVLGLPQDNRILLYCGRIHPIKRVLETIHAFREAAVPGWTFLVVGPIDAAMDGDVFEAACRACGATCRYVGPIYGDGLWDYYKAASVFITLSRKENYCHGIIEAAACGVPSIVSDEMDLAPEVSRRGAGIVLGAKSLGNVSSALRELLSISERELLEQGQRARTWAVSELTPRAFANALQFVLQGVFARVDASSEPRVGAQ